MKTIASQRSGCDQFSYDRIFLRSWTVGIAAMVISSAAIFGPQRLRVPRSTSNKMCPAEVWRGERERDLRSAVS